jgi:xanthine dehydrogenase accessory factor
MNDNKYLSGVIREQLEAGSHVVLVSIISMEGSAPRGSGTKMVVGVDGKSYGTVGGSLLEASAIAESQNVLTSRKSRVIDFDLAGNDTSGDGMICGGKAVLLLDFILATTDNQQLMRRMYDTISAGRNLYYLTAFRRSGGSLDIDGHSLLFSDGSLYGDDILTESGRAELKDELHTITSTTVLSIGEKSVVVDPISEVKTLYCFGAGHVAVPTAHIAAMCGFDVVVIDDRQEFANTKRFPEASQIRVIDDFGHALEGLKIDSDSFMVIITRGHQYDRLVLAQVLKTGASYIGMISSRSKRDAIYKALIATGVASVEDLTRVHSPIGLEIGAETPEEIAVSIVAELIYERDKQRKL